MKEIIEKNASFKQKKKPFLKISEGPPHTHVLNPDKKKIIYLMIICCVEEVGVL